MHGSDGASDRRNLGIGAIDWDGGSVSDAGLRQAMVSNGRAQEKSRASCSGSRLASRRSGLFARGGRECIESVDGRHPMIQGCHEALPIQ